MGLIATLVKALKRQTIKELVSKSIQAGRQSSDKERLLDVYCKQFADRGYIISSLPDDPYGAQPVAAVFVWKRTDLETPGMRKRLKELRQQGYRISIGLIEP